MRSGGLDVFRNTSEGLSRAGDDSDEEGGGLRVKLASGAGAALTPQRALLAKGESHLLLLTPDGGAGRGSHSVYDFDVERGSVVAQWSCKKDDVAIPMRDISCDAKDSQLGEGATFMGLDDNRLCRWDMRAASGVVQTLSSPAVLSYAGGHDFARGTGFTCMATTGEGDVVVGGADGRIRLYSDSSLRQAKTSFPGIGSAITHVDVTYDGKFILATTDAYLMVISTSFRDAKNAVKTGFRAKMGKNIAAPRLLKLLPADAAKTGNAPLRKARFTWVTTADATERWISAACGAYSVVWNFRHVKQTTAPGSGTRECLEYNLLDNKEKVVDSAMMHSDYAGRAGANALVLAATGGGRVEAYLGEDE